jgi:hypothetical protein
MAISSKKNAKMPYFLFTAVKNRLLINQNTLLIKLSRSLMKGLVSLRNTKIGKEAMQEVEENLQGVSAAMSIGLAIMAENTIGYS